MAKTFAFFKVEMIVLTLLLEKDYYTYELVKEIFNRSDGVIEFKEGSLYPSLYKMIDKGYITSREEIHNRRIRVIYHIEESGKDYLKTLTNTYRLWEEKINEILANQKDYLK